MTFGKIEKGLCLGPCGKTNVFIVNKSKKLCQWCNQARLKEGKSKRSGLSGTEQRDLFLKIYEESLAADTWYSEISGKPLPKLPEKAEKNYEYKITQFYSCFSHVLSKGTYPELKLLRKNIWKVTPAEHTIWGNDPGKIEETTGAIWERWQKKIDMRIALLREIAAGKYSKYSRSIQNTVDVGNAVHDPES